MNVCRQCGCVQLSGVHGNIRQLQPLHLQERRPAQRTGRRTDRQVSEQPGRHGGQVEHTQHDGRGASGPLSHRVHCRPPQENHRQETQARQGQDMPALQGQVTLITTYYLLLTTYYYPFYHSTASLLFIYF